jgi:hypothetical protein
MALCLPPSQRPSPSKPANRRNWRDLPTHGPETLIKRRTHTAPSWRRRQPRLLTSSKLTKSRVPGPVAIPALGPRPSNPHRSRSTQSASSGPRFPPREAFGPRPRGGAPCRVGAGVRNPSPSETFVATDDHCSATGRSRPEAVLRFCRRAISSSIAARPREFASGQPPGGVGARIAWNATQPASRRSSP